MGEKRSIWLGGGSSRTQTGLYEYANSIDHSAEESRSVWHRIRIVFQEGLRQ